MSQIVSVATFCFLFVTIPYAAAADHRANLKRSYPATGITHLVVDNRVGEVDLRPGMGDTFEVLVELEGNRHGILRQLKSVAGLDVTSKTGNGRLHLKFNEDDVEAEWTILLPKNSPEDITVNQGVGEVDIDAPTAAIRVDLGVGDVDVSTSKASAGDIALTVGVGEAAVRGGPNAVKASGVASNANSKGDGSREVSITVGVGDASVVLN